MTDFSNSTGLEALQTAALVLMHDQINDAIADAEAAGQARDAALGERLGIEMPEIELERVDLTPHGSSPTGNIYFGHRPSLINADINGYPNIAIIADRFDPLGGGIDQGYDLLDRLRIEIMVKGLGENGEELVNRRIQRTMDAVNAVVQSNPTLGGTVQGLEEQSRGFIGNVFPRKAETSYGTVWYWQGAQLNYAVRKTSVLSSNASPEPLLAGAQPALVPHWADADIDQ
jgi:hypothetical protein